MTPADAAPPPAVEMVVSRKEESAVVAALDLPLMLTKGKRREDALVRRAVFVNAQLTVVRPAAGADRYRWSAKAFLQRQVCVTSIAGLFACTTPEIETLAESVQGEAPVDKPDAYPLADAARGSLEAGLRTRAEALFAADRRTNIDPVFKAAGVGVVKAAR
jgi:hypothetical protein